MQDACVILELVSPLQCFAHKVKIVLLLRAIYLVLEFIDGKELFDEIVEGVCAFLGLVATASQPAKL